LLKVDYDSSLTIGVRRAVLREVIASTQTNQPFVSSPRAYSNPQTFVADALATLRRAGFRITQPRTRLLNILGQRNEPITVEELHAALGTAECDLVTVYRCLTTFEELGIVARTYRHSGTTLYEKREGGERPYRVICKVTNRVEPIDPTHAAPIRAAIQQVEDLLRAQGYEQVNHVLEFFVVSPELTRPSAPQVPSRAQTQARVPSPHDP
jgi:Fur family transcriptional regulator, ferric uptake regulator